MALTTGTASALVGGSSRKQPKPRMLTVEIVRGVFIDGGVRNPGDIVELPDYEANHMVSIGKAKKFVPPQEQPPDEESVNEKKRMGRKVKPQEVGADGSD